ncbi:hypothetical protein PCCS19_36210 [Paenibacillus sp. CCS19]|uniref:restriction endonuclease n=1 Tax=Paenibacillus sp. CCS19 TaxID=3158387 RepID=UPI0025694DE0|nr:restriction endonuclease [Paenibacillus cellulosilyticus]GMK40565.1 hypothetical protein PCCS19_36210 [Paenibacillus cellulosilyticus]
MSIHTMDGYDFERLITQLLKKMGFSVEMTSLSGDGGVDIIAYSSSFIFKGKYLIQCKRWNNAVGEPAVRDLYGVVLSEQANKGILITNSTFSNKAIAFASGKNLELIDGTALMKLLQEYHLDPSIETAPVAYTTSFDEMASFDGDKYRYLKARIESDRSERQHYDSLRAFLHAYIAKNEIEINKNGLIDAYLQLNNEFIQRFCKKTKINLVEKEVVTYLNGILYLLKGDIFKAMEIYKEDLKLTAPENLNILLHNYSINSAVWKNEEGELVSQVRDEHGLLNNVRKTLNKSPSLMIINLYLILYKLNYKKGLNVLMAHLKTTHKQALANKNGSALYKYQVGLMFNDIKQTISKIANNTYNEFYLPVDLNYKIDKNYYKDYYYLFTFNEQTYLTVDQIMYQYWANPPSEQELRRLDILFS